MGYNYTTIDKVSITARMREDCVETVANDDLRTSTDATRRVVLKWDQRDEKPPSLGDAIVYSHAEILVELARAEWNPPEEEEL